MSSGSTKPPGGPESRQHERKAGRTAAKAMVALPATIFMPFIVLWRTLRSIWKDRDTRGILVTAALLLFAGTIIFMILEDFSPIDSFYFSFITLATIGYGDFAPSSELSRLVTVAFSISGLGIMAALISSIASHRVRTDYASAIDGTTKGHADAGD